MTERLRRQWAACEAESLGRGGVSLVAQATGLSRTTIWAGRRELRRRADRPQDDLTPERVRAPGGGRHLVEQDDPALLTALADPGRIVHPGGPAIAPVWTSKSTRNLAEELGGRGHPVSHQTVAALLDDWGYSLQANRKTKEGQDHPDRDAQFEYINRQVRAFQEAGQPVVSVDAKKKELVGDFRNPGREWHRRGQPEEVRAKDFPDKQLGKAIPEGVYDLSRERGLGQRRDRSRHGRVRRGEHPALVAGDGVARSIPRPRRLLITADAGGSNGYRSRLWKVALQGLADDLGLRISVCHFPPGTSKWNKIEHRMFCHITKNWRGRPLAQPGRRREPDRPHDDQGRVADSRRSWIPDAYRNGIKVSDEELAAIKLEKASFHGEWNYTIAPKA